MQPTNTTFMALLTPPTPTYFNDSYLIRLLALFITINANQWVKNPVYKGVIQRMHLMLQPEPRLELRPLKNLFLIYYTLLEDNQVPLIPNASYNINPYSFLDQILLRTSLVQSKTFKVHLYIIMLDERDSNPFETQRPYTLCMFTLQEQMLA